MFVKFLCIFEAWSISEYHQTYLRLPLTPMLSLVNTKYYTTRMNFIFTRSGRALSVNIMKYNCLLFQRQQNTYTHPIRLEHHICLFFSPDSQCSHQDECCLLLQKQGVELAFTFACPMTLQEPTQRRRNCSIWTSSWDWKICCHFMLCVLTIDCWVPSKLSRGGWV